MKHTKKAQLETMKVWFTAMVIIFAIFITFMVWNRPWQMLDNKITPMINPMEVNGRDIMDLLPKFRRNQGLIPVIFIASVFLWAVMSSLKQDPNYPVQ